MRHYSGEFEGIRLLMLDELDAIAGGDGEDTDDIVVTGRRPLPPSVPLPPPGGYGSGSPPPPPPPPPCTVANPITGIEAPDGGDYSVPEGVDGAYLQNAINHIIDIRNTQGKVAVAREIANMYENPSNPFFIDFKDAGSTRGPSGWVDGGDVSYFSSATNHQVQADRFEAFGNFFFGVITTLGGFAYEETKAIAALVQNDRFDRLRSWEAPLAIAEAALYGDDPTDRPFVDDGVAKAQAYAANPQVNGNMFGVDTVNCS